jgi:hypothetical protein
MAIPAYAVIDGLGLNLFRYATSNGGGHVVQTVRVGFRKANGDKFWFDVVEADPWATTSPIEEVQYPVSGGLDLLGAPGGTWTRNAVNNDGFGVLIRARNDGTEAAELGVSCLEVVIEYTCPNGATSGDICDPPAGAGCAGQPDGTACDNSVWCDGSDGSVFPLLQMYRQHRPFSSNPASRRVSKRDLRWNANEHLQHLRCGSCVRCCVQRASAVLWGTGRDALRRPRFLHRDG